MWKEVARQMGGGVKFRVEATLDKDDLGENKNQRQNWAEPNVRRVRFGV